MEVFRSAPLDSLVAETPPAFPETAPALSLQDTASHHLQERQSALPVEIFRSLTTLDDQLVEVIRSGCICLVRSSWVLTQPDGFKVPWRQALESNALLSPDDAVKLIRRGSRCVGVVSYRWLSRAHPVCTCALHSVCPHSVCAYHLTSVSTLLVSTIRAPTIRVSTLRARIPSKPGSLDRV